jgi:hypothetical protein
LILFIAASASWLMSLFASPVLGTLLNVVAAYGFWRVAQGFDAWRRQRRHVSYELASVASRGAAVAVAVSALGVAPLLAHAHANPMETWGARMLLYLMWTGLWLLYYYVLQLRLEDLGAASPIAKYPLTFTALGASILLSPLLTEGLPAPPEAKLALATSMYAGFLPPFNISALLAALLARR